MPVEKQLTPVNEWVENRVPRIVRESLNKDASKFEFSEVKKKVEKDLPASIEYYTGCKILLTGIKSKPGNTILLGVNSLNHV